MRTPERGRDDDVRISPLDPDDEGDLQSWFTVRRAARALDLPTDPQPGWRRHVASVRLDPGGDRPEVALAWASSHVSTTIGGYALTLPMYDNLHAATVEVIVAPEHRRHGVGSALLAHAQQRALTSDRRLLIGETPEGSAGSSFAARRGATLGLVDVRRVLDLPSMPPQTVAALLDEARSAAVGYSLVDWVGPVPAEYLEDCSVLLGSMSDAPTDDLDWGEEAFPPERIRRMEQYNELAGDRQYTVAARCDSTGRLVALSTVFVRGEHPWTSAQGDTIVLAAHRGHRLGLLVKAAMLELLPAREPEVRRLVTWNAASNRHMIAINEALGYQVLDRWQEWQLAIRGPRDLPRG